MNTTYSLHGLGWSRASFQATLAAAVFSILPACGGNIALGVDHPDGGLANGSAGSTGSGTGGNLGTGGTGGSSSSGSAGAGTTTSAGGSSSTTGGGTSGGGDPGPVQIPAACSPPGKDPLVAQT